MKKLILLLIPLLAACERHHAVNPLMSDLPGFSGSKVGQPVKPVPQVPSIVIVAGQSNAQTLYISGGLSGFSAGFHAGGGTVPDDTRYVSCAIGGSNIDAWQPGTPNYQHCVDIVKQSGRKPFAILWSQGEEEGAKGVNDWGNKFLNFAMQFRSEIGVPTLPITYSRLGDVLDRAGYPYLDDLRAVQTALHVPNGIMVNIDGLPVGPDGTHYTSESSPTIGYRHGLALAALMED